MKILLTGGAGFIGSHIYDRCRNAGHDIVVLDDLSTGNVGNLPHDADVRVVNITDRDGVENVFRGAGFDIVCHHAAQISVSESVKDPRRDAEINCMGWLNVLDCAARYGVRRAVFASSGGTLYGNVMTPAREFNSIRPVSPYGVSKRTGEQYLEFYAKQYNMEAVSLRYGNVYGPRQNPHGEAGVVAIFCRNTLQGKPVTIYGNGRQVRDYVYVADVVDANVMAMGNKDIFRGEMITANIGTGVGTEVNSLAFMIRHEVMSQFPALYLDRIDYAPQRPGDLQSSLLNPVWAYDRLNWLPITKLKEGVAKTVAWFQHLAADI